ncbi:MAG: DegT/DnrJ/EryC1/StrS aminotransferase [Microgenomates group bacterium GW2011_GWC1_43_11]|uniref:DegT/DnrJ/EryC1/StrS aminotransferase n=2 Tax=Candidatus Gottesmaniibacteriota TaxID=1752720 RepID=A0A0G1IQK9_9BACT|nr:MAG: DegT/DnrJ/EryC1/StrS aminotransferase [Microgenomates group bacterium GW2011_GWC1_43_11]KKT39158.1 MAG: DegT/DnrJ/EryC1/StrS aminotransferase [Candidatus Gottesmanbacteria bacterium GW2011_GWB1_44_11c]KKT61631.1 MAG: DegT/DnrJ/EryC1/StrS aminotransferase [Candidatus Gottesmanbacteria bacterium GW2011_GWA1_44_24b]HCM82172.1 lipopolysaccharide biosynthesis protein RfbH [Patescibacteria group bacterium]
MKYIPATGKVFDQKEVTNAIQAARDGWWTEGRFAKKFEKEFSSYIGIKYVSLVNSGSSANLLALSALTSAVFGKRALKPGDEVITAACAFPTTVNPIVQNQCIPVFIDVDILTKNSTVEMIQKAVSKRTKAIMLAHTLGNPLPLAGIMELVKKYDLWFIEDCCDALGSQYNGKPVSAFGSVATFSFYPAHQITMGEGGAVVTNNPLIHRSVRQFRDWGRDCWCDTGYDNTCGKRFDWQLGNLPKGFDHKYIYSQIGYNVKLTDFQAAIGVAQLEKLPKFIKKRKKNFQDFYIFFKEHEKYFILPGWEKEADPCWFGFMLVVKDDAPFTRLELVKYLEEHKIGSRNLFAGNLLKHPAYLKRKDYRVAGTLHNSDLIMNNGFWIGVYPGITPKHIVYMKKVFQKFIDMHAS